jgi:hypothetical protein
MYMKTIVHSLIFTILSSMTLSVLATPITCDPITSCISTDAWQDINIQEEQGQQLQAHNVSSVQQEILLKLMKSQAEDRYAIRNTARLALKNLQQLAVSNEYNQSTAKELALIYGKAVAQLAYLDIQLAVRFRNKLSEAQLKALQEKIDLHR